MRKPFFSDSPEQSLAHAFADHIVSWVNQISVQDQVTIDWLKEAARHVSMAVSAGDSCFLLDELMASNEEQDIDFIRQKLLDSGVVGTPDKPVNCPLILDEDNRIYLHRYFDYERTLAERLIRLCQPCDVDVKKLRPRLDTLFPQAADNTAPDWQKIAVSLALRQSLLIISGGPGTGKTTTVARLLSCILETSSDNRIMLAAPTGKAARRMLDSISERLDLFPPHLQAAIPKEAYTIHRLLGVTTDLSKARYHEGNHLPCDTLIVDEASMLDLALASKLFAALPDKARVILLGDKDQLAAVEAGSVFSALSSRFVLSGACRDALKELTGYALTDETLPKTGENTGEVSLLDSVVWLMKNYRFSETSGIGRLAADIRDKRLSEAIHFLCEHPDSSVQWLDMDDASVLSGFGKTLTRQFDDYFHVVKNQPHDVERVFDTFNSSRILCAVREGHYGVYAVNRFLANALSNLLSAGKQAVRAGQTNWLAGQPVMVRRNDYVLKLFNGDVGIVLPDAAEHLCVFFQNDDGTFRAIPPSRLNHYETSFAMTVHQSQGSEFDSVLLLLPSEPSRVLSRELIYTGITRARSKIQVACRMSILQEGLKQDCARRSGLASRIMEIKTDRERKQ